MLLLRLLLLGLFPKFRFGDAKFEYSCPNRRGLGEHSLDLLNMKIKYKQFQCHVKKYMQNLQDNKHIYAITFAFEVSYNMPSLGEVPPHRSHEIY